MAWNSNPQVRDLGAYCDKYNFPIGVFFGLKRNGKTIEVVTYGKSRELCTIAKKLGDQTWDAIESGIISP